jgi:uncharacterized damage-inducible protein DinB
MNRALAFVALLMFAAVPLFAQTAAPATPAAPAQAAAPAGPTDPLSRMLFNSYNTAKLNITQSAEKVSEADYAFQPTKEVMTFAQMLGHVANSQFTYCAAAKGEPNPNKDDFQKNATTKAAIQKALADVFAYCNTVYGTMTDARAMELITSGTSQAPRAGRLIGNLTHVNEHYGNLVTYMRIKGYVPPSTERALQQQQQQKK